MIDLHKLTIKEAHESLKRGDFSAKELTQDFLKNIEAKNKEINAYLEIFDDVLDQADMADKKIAEGKISSLTGIPFGMKDNIMIKGRNNTSASKILKNFISPYDATVIQKLKSENVIFLGRTNLDEFAMGSSTENSVFGVTKNPVDTSRVAGGSSGGSVAAVAMGGALGALGSDTGGSVREPAAFCGVVGLKPTYGSVSRYGLMAMGSSLDVIGPIAKTVTDAEIIFDVIKGKDKMDSTSHDNKFEAKKHGSKMIIGVPYHILEQDGIDPSIRKNFDESIQKLKNLSYEIRDIKLPSISYALAVYYILMPAEVSSNLARFDGVKYGLHTDGQNLLDDYLKTRREGFGPEVRRRVLIGTYVLSSGYYDAYYNKANIVRQKISDEFAQAFKEIDAIASPITPYPAFKIGEKADDPLAMYLADIFTVPANIVGVPAISIPSGLVAKDGVSLPIGLQLLAPHGGESVLFEIGKKFLNE